MDYRRFKLALMKLRKMRLNADFFRYLKNRIKWLRVNPHRTLLLPFPKGLMLELGNRCNLHCIICPREYDFGKQMDQGFMPLERAKQMIDEVYPYLDSIGLTGLGETFLYPHLLEVCQYIKQRKPDIIITASTNAHFVGFLEKAAPVLPYIGSLQISVDGIGKMYESIRPNTDFNYIADNIRELVKMGSDTVFMLNTVVTVENYRDLIPVIEFADEVGIRFVNFNMMNLASIPSKRDQYTEFFRSRELKDSLRKLRIAAKRYPHIKADIPDENVIGTHEGSFQECDALWNHHYITWDGYMMPCCAKPFPKELNFGNAFEDGVMGTLNGEKAINMRKMWQKNCTLSFCKTCNAISG